MTSSEAMRSIDSDATRERRRAGDSLRPAQRSVLAPHLSKLADYEAYYTFLLAAWRVSAHVRMLSAEDGREIFTCTAARYDVTINPSSIP